MSKAALDDQIDQLYQVPLDEFTAARNALAKESGQLKVKVPGGAVGATSTADPKSIHVAFPGDDVQVEVFAPSPATARHVVTSGQVRPVR